MIDVFSIRKCQRKLENCREQSSALFVRCVVKNVESSYYVEKCLSIEYFVGRLLNTESIAVHLSNSSYMMFGPCNNRRMYSNQLFYTTLS